MNYRGPASFYDNKPNSVYRISFIPLLLLLGLISFFARCDSKELTRPRAAEIIRTSNEFKKDVAIALLPEYCQSLVLIGTGNQGMSKEELALRRFFESNADLAVLNHLGLVDFKIKNIESPDSAASPVTITSSLTEKGRSSSREWKQSAERWIIPIAKKEFVEVTGLTGNEGESKQASVEYTWKWRPTEIRTNFDTPSQAYKNLPDSIRLNFGGASFADMMGNAGRIIVFDSSKAQKATAKLQLYDDGWRIV
ncbi:MAG TPA: hypothetical protein VF543_16220 [Pyrinomonadaceae bacterium]